MRKGFVFGKFLPFHMGHKAMMEFALTHCEKLFVVVCGSDKETLAAEARASWIRDTFSPNTSIEVITFDYKEDLLPNTSVSSREVSAVWAKAFQALLPDTDLLVTSEPYGEYVADYMGIRHIPFDPQRVHQPISATSIREDIFRHWDFLPDAVKRHYQQKVVVLGTECTGKTTISETAAQLMSTSWVEEAGRKIVENSNHFTVDHLYLIAAEHARLIREAEQELKPLILIDTDIHITQSYAKYEFGSYLDVPDSIYQTNKANLYCYLTRDLPFEQDGTRLDETYRNKLDEFHRATIKKFGIQVTEIGGTWEKRLERFMQKIKTHCVHHIQ
ncbi:AAA family ATPase [Limibacter armeniacum]|uniref:AAA family ATPase n=1 Tax=Limibacter armeniacum TaxID=466084 RepID=UPI002FE5EABD